jgi:hypothetical protein
LRWLVLVAACGERERERESESFHVQT